MAALGVLLNLLVIALNGGQMPAAIDPSVFSRMAILIRAMRCGNTGSDF